MVMPTIIPTTSPPGPVGREITGSGSHEEEGVGGGVDNGALLHLSHLAGEAPVVMPRQSCVCEGGGCGKRFVSLVVFHSSSTSRTKRNILRPTLTLRGVLPVIWRRP